MSGSLSAGRPRAHRIFFVAWVIAAVMVSACTEKNLTTPLGNWLEIKKVQTAKLAKPSEVVEPTLQYPPESFSLKKLQDQRVESSTTHQAWEPKLALAAPSPAREAIVPPVITLTKPKEKPTPTRVALLLPLSGSEETLGKALLDAAFLALFETGDEHLTLVPKDTKGTAEGARAATRAVLAEGVQLILGPVFSGSVKAAAGPARPEGINIIAFSTDRSVAGNGVYLLGFMPGQQVERVIQFALKKRLQRFAAIIPETAYGNTIANELDSAITRYGGQITQIERYEINGSDYDKPVRQLANYDYRKTLLLNKLKVLKSGDTVASQLELKRLKKLDVLGPLDYQAVMIAEGGSRLRTLVPLLPFYDIDPSKVQFLGTGLWDDPTLGSEPALIGSWFAGPPPLTATLFSKRFQATYGYNPPRIASLAYDATALAAALNLKNHSPDFSESALTQPSGFAGADGIFRFRPDGIADRGLAIIKITPDGLRVIDKAPRTFNGS